MMGERHVKWAIHVNVFIFVAMAKINWNGVSDGFHHCFECLK